jgi:hypothetical protein
VTDRFSSHEASAGPLKSARSPRALLSLAVRIAARIRELFSFISKEGAVRLILSSQHCGMLLTDPR